MPALLLLNLVEPHEGQRLVRFKFPITRPYLFRTVAPYLAPRPFILVGSGDLGTVNGPLYDSSDFISFKLGGTSSLKNLICRHTTWHTFLPCAEISLII